MLRTFLFFTSFVLLFSACEKEQTVFENNAIPDYEGVSGVLLNNYVNRVFIDLIGREPLNSEMEQEVALLRENNLSVASRTDLVTRLISSTDFVEGDSSYRRAYSVKVYENMKARFIEGASDALIQQRYGIIRNNAIADSLEGNLTAYAIKMAEANRLQELLASRGEFETGEITIATMTERMVFNAIYDEINMNTFNFVNACFDDLYFRFPSTAEFEVAYQIVELNEAGTLFGQTAQDKAGFVQLMTSTGEYTEGMITWAYQSLLSRNPQSHEVFQLAPAFENNQALSEIQQTILISDEYAGFD